MKSNLFLVAMLAVVLMLIQGCALDALPSGETWYKPGISADQTKLDWSECQLAVLHKDNLQTSSEQSGITPNQSYNSSGTVQPNVYGLGVNADQYGRPTTYQLQNGQQLDPTFNAGVKQNAYGPGVGQDQFGRPVYNTPYGAGSTSGYYDGGQGSDAGGQIAFNAFNVLTENSRAKHLMFAKGYRLVSTNSPVLKDRPEHFTDADFK